MDQLPIHFVAGLPRSGSTLLLNLLGQNPAVHVTPTSGLVDLVAGVARQWRHNVWHQAEGLDIVRPRMRHALGGMIAGYHAEPLESGKVVFDKNRAWLKYIEEVELALGLRVRVIVMVRDIRDVLASMERLYCLRDLDYPADMPATVEERCELWLSPRGVVGSAARWVQDAIRRVSDRLLVVPYEALTSQPCQVLSGLAEQLDLPTYAYDPDHVDQVTHENDAIHGMDLHRVRPHVEPNTSRWSDVLPLDYAATVARRFAWLDSFINFRGAA